MSFQTFYQSSLFLFINLPTLAHKTPYSSFLKPQKPPILIPKHHERTVHPYLFVVRVHKEHRWSAWTEEFERCRRKTLAVCQKSGFRIARWPRSSEKTVQGVSLGRACTVTLDSCGIHRATTASYFRDGIRKSHWSTRERERGETRFTVADTKNIVNSCYRRRRRRVASLCLSFCLSFSPRHLSRPLTRD